MNLLGEGCFGTLRASIFYIINEQNGNFSLVLFKKGCFFIIFIKFSIKTKQSIVAFMVETDLGKSLLS